MEGVDQKELACRVRSATGAHNKLEKLVQHYYNEPTALVADDILRAAEELREAWYPPTNRVPIGGRSEDDEFAQQ